MDNNLLRTVRTKDIIEKYKFRFNKDLGQNFLIDDKALKDIINAANLTKEDSVIEVGPGIGTLTVELAEHAAKVLTIEIDKNLINILQDVFQGYDNIKLYHGDALKVDLKEAASGFLTEPVTICANLPYYITTPLIAKFFKEKLKIKNIVLMVQKEVADRMAAEPNSREYGSLSLLVQYYSKPSIVSVVPAHCFIPKPKVDSVIIKLDVYETPPVTVYNEDLFFRIVRDSFNQRRKTLSNSLKGVGLSKEKLSTAFDNVNIDPKRRGETLSLQEFAALSNEIYSLL